MLKLYDYYRSSAAFRVRIALALKGLDAEREFIHLRHGVQRGEAYLAVNAQGLVPTLIDDTESCLVLSQSMAIIEYLDETRPAPPLLPAEPAGRARVRALSQLIACDIHPINNLRVLGHLTAQYGIDGERRTQSWYQHWVKLGFDALEAQLSRGSSTGAYCHGETPTMADCCLVPQVFNATRFGTDLADYPMIEAIFETCMANAAFIAAQPESQPDAE